MRILIAEDDPVSRRVLETTLARWGHEVVVTCDGAEAWAALSGEDAPPLAVLDWMMPGMDGVEVCRRLQRAENTSRVYTILLTAKGGKKELVEGLESGADDYLTKPFDREELRARIKVGARIIELQSTLVERVRELEEAVAERKRAEEALLQLSLTDDLTALYNRRGFFAFVERHLKTARRSGQSSLLIYADMDGLKAINDTLGHIEGSLAITSVADILRRTFRDADIIARLGGDEFTILAVNSSLDDVDQITSRLRENLLMHNRQADNKYELSVSIGVAHVDPHDNLPLEDLIAAADKLMYEQKRQKKKAQLIDGGSGKS
jgi:diguanylate cyclase (GGDEF)-like protein